MNGYPEIATDPKFSVPDMFNQSCYQVVMGELGVHWMPYIIQRPEMWRWN